MSSEHIQSLKALTSSNSVKELVEKATSGKADGKVKIVDVRSVTVNTTDVKRCFIEVSGSDNASESVSSLRNVGWVVNEQLLSCLLCTTKFSMFASWKHHCRACGLLVCGSCSSKKATLKGSNDAGSVIVCDTCFKNKTGDEVPFAENNEEGNSLVNTTASTATVESNVGEQKAVEEPAASAEKEEETKVEVVVEEKADVEVVNTEPAVETAAEETKEVVEVEEKVVVEVEEEEVEQVNVKEEEVVDTAATTVTTEEVTVPAAPKELNVIANAGFVIKTLTEDEKKTKVKVFINVLHHEAVEDAEKSLFKHSATNDQDSQVVAKVFVNKKPMEITDKHGEEALLFNALVSSEYFTEEKTPITDSVSIQKIIEVINVTFNESLSEQDYVRPRMAAGFTGDKSAVFNTELTFIENLHPVSTYLRINDDDTRSVVSMVVPSPVHASGMHAGFRSGSGYDLSSSLPTVAGSLLQEQMHKQESSNSLAQLETASDYSDSNASASVNGTRTQTKRQSSTASLGAISRQSSRKNSWFGTKVGFPVTGVELLSPEDLEYLPELNVDSTKVDELIKTSGNDATCLLGYQIQLFPEESAETVAASKSKKNKKNKNKNEKKADVSSLVVNSSKNVEVFVITGIRKNSARQSEYRLSNLLGEDQWVRLYRGEKKPGQRFQPFRQVLHEHVTKDLIA